MELRRLGPIPPITDEQTAQSVRRLLAGYEEGIAMLEPGNRVRAQLERQATELRTRLIEWEQR